MNTSPRLRQAAHNLPQQYQGYLAPPASEFHPLDRISSYLRALLFRNCVRRGYECIYLPHMPRRRRTIATTAALTPFVPPSRAQH
jgi:hypothetical protein